MSESAKHKEKQKGMETFSFFHVINGSTECASGKTKDVTFGKIQIKNLRNEDLGTKPIRFKNY